MFVPFKTRCCYIKSYIIFGCHSIITILIQEFTRVQSHDYHNNLISAQFPTITQTYWSQKKKKSLHDLIHISLSYGTVHLIILMTKKIAQTTPEIACWIQTDQMEWQWFAFSPHSENSWVQIWPGPFCLDFTCSMCAWVHSGSLPQSKNVYIRLIGDHRMPWRCECYG